MITFEDFKKLELKIAKIISAERIEGSEKLLKLKIDAGEKFIKDPENISAGELGLKKEIAGAEEDEKNAALQEKKTRQLIAGIGKSYAPEDLLGKEIVIIANLEPRKIMGLLSEGMLLAAGDESGPIIIIPQKETDPGTKIS